MSGKAQAGSAKRSADRRGLGLLPFLRLAIAHARRHAARSGIVAGGSVVLSTLSDLMAVARENFAWIMLILAVAFLAAFLWWRFGPRGEAAAGGGADCDHWTCAVPVPVAAIALVAGFLWMVRESAAEGADHSAIITQLAALRGDVAAVKRDTGRTVDIVEEALGADTLVKNPRTAADFLRNARILERRGDMEGAFAALEQHVVRAAPVQYDVAEVYATQLSSRLGPGAAIDRLEELAADGDQPALAVHRALLTADRAVRLRLLEEVVRRHPDYGPGYFALANQQVLVGSREMHAAAQRNFRGFLDARGNAKHFTEAARFQQIVTQAQAMLSSLEGASAVYETALPRFDVRYVASPTGLGLRAFVTVGEVTKTRRVLIDGQVVQEAEGMRFEPVDVPMTAREIAVEYLDVAGRWQGPLTRPVDPIRELRTQSRTMMEQISAHRPWFELTVRSMGGIRGPDGRPAQLVSGGFTFSQFHFLAVRRIHFGYDRERPDQSIEVGVPDEAIRKGTVNWAEYQSRLPKTFPPGLRIVSVQLEYFDGTRSPVRQFTVQNQTRT